jgi:hypothetical protein
MITELHAVLIPSHQYASNFQNRTNNNASKVPTIRLNYTGKKMKEWPRYLGPPIGIII